MSWPRQTKQIVPCVPPLRRTFRRYLITSSKLWAGFSLFMRYLDPHRQLQFLQGALAGILVDCEFVQLALLYPEVRPWQRQAVDFRELPGERRRKPLNADPWLVQMPSP